MEANAVFRPEPSLRNRRSYPQLPLHMNGLRKRSVAIFPLTCMLYFATFESSTRMRAATQTAAAEYPHPHEAWYAVVVLAIAYVFSFIDRQILSLLVTPIRRDLNISDTQISLLMGISFALF